MKTEVISIHPEFPDIRSIVRCAQVIRDGGLVIFPTETVYGIGADFKNPQAMHRLREVKKRSENKPFSVLISQPGLITNYTNLSTPMLYKLIDAYWPGPLTIVVPGKEGEETIGVRMPDNAIALKLVQESKSIFAAPSANFEGNPPPLTCAEALKDLDGLVEVAIDGGPARLGKGSTVVDLTKDEPKVLREGVITQTDIDKTTSKKTILFVCTGNSCRSVMAEYLLKSRIHHRNDIEVYSAGTGVFLRSTASSETVSVLHDEGIDATKHLSQGINSILLKKADLIFVMTHNHRQHVLERAPEVEHRVYMLREFVNNPSGFQTELDIPDPMGHSHAEYKHCLSVIREAVDKIVELI